jgi:hypothetical protein
MITHNLEEINMKEFMLYIRNVSSHTESMPPEQHEKFLNACSVYIGELKKEGKLKAAQPLVREGKIISGSDRGWKEVPFNETGEVNVGYYHILANDLNDAVAIAKRNPEFQYSTTARIEVRPIKVKEETTGFVYPNKA